MNKHQEQRKNEIKYVVKQWDYNNAYTLINEYISDYPNDLYMVVYKGLILNGMNKEKEALEILEQVLSIGGLDKRIQTFALSECARAYRKIGEYDKALDTYLDIINISEDIEIFARCSAARLYTSKAEYDKAIGILEVPGFNTQALNNERAFVYITRGDTLKARQAISRKEENLYNVHVKIKIDPKKLEQATNYYCGRIEDISNNIEKAKTYYTKALSIKNNRFYYLALLELAYINYKHNNVNDAIEMVNNIITKLDDKLIVSKAYELLAKCYIKKNDYKKAHQAFSKCENEHARLHGMARAEVSRYNFDKAIHLLDKIIADKTDYYHDSVALKAIILFRQGKYEEMLETYSMLENTTDIKNNIYDRELKRAKLYADIALHNEIDDKVYTYYEKQIIGYSKDNTLQHIRDHHTGECSITSFNDDINIDGLVDNVSNLVVNASKFCSLTLDSYIIKYDNIGHTADGKNIHYLTFVCKPDTFDVISMYPYTGDETDSDLDEVVSKPKVKRLSQVEKFNQRYNRR